MLTEKKWKSSAEQFSEIVFFFGLFFFSMGVLVGKWDLEQECESFPMMFMLQAAESVLIHSVRGQFGTELKVCKAEAGEFFLQERDKRIQKVYCIWVFPKIGVPLNHPF